MQSFKLLLLESDFLQMGGIFLNFQGNIKWFKKLKENYVKVQRISMRLEEWYVNIKEKVLKNSLNVHIASAPFFSFSGILSW